MTDLNSRFDPASALFRELNDVEQPARYLGGEVGSIVKDHRDLYRIALCFPDLYEIGMSNTALKILYGQLNRLPGVAAERVFSPAEDFEEVLRTHNALLYTLETKTALGDCDMVAFTFAYELLATNMLTALDLGGIPVLASQRTEGDPLVIAGGPGLTNPVPYGMFLDAVFIGEGEGEFTLLAETLATMKQERQSREEKLRYVHSHPAIWYAQRDSTVRRAIWQGFTSETSDTAYGAGFPVPSIPIVQDHGVVEIMRGCPQGCRFCQAGVYYRPYRMRTVDHILREIDWLVNVQGYREISLSSLSSGDYGPLHELMAAVHQRYSAVGVSLQLPSLRVDSFTLPILEQLKENKRAGLTFAVESADAVGQLRNNKIAELEDVISIAAEARRRGWRRAKLYFMIGLPATTPDSEADAIIVFVQALRRAVPMEYVVNVGTFVPKPHTPFQWERQLQPEETTAALERLRRSLPKGCKLRTHDPWTAWVEGILARGDNRAGEALYEVWKQGARFDAWGEKLKLGLWKSAVLSLHGSDSGLNERNPAEPLPWSHIHLGVAQGVLRRERERGLNGTLTEQCAQECARSCGVCNSQNSVRHLDSTVPEPLPEPVPTAVVEHIEAEKARGRQLFFRYGKTGNAAFLPHLALVRVFERLWYRMNLPIQLSEGYHRKLKMSFGQPLPIGVESDDEIGVVELQKNIPVEDISQCFNSIPQLPEGIFLKSVVIIDHEPEEPRVPAPMQLYQGTRILASPVTVGSQELSDSVTRFVDACNDLGGNTAQPAAGQLSWRITLDRDAPGIGRIMKQSETRGLVRLRREQLFGPDGVSLFSWYCRHHGAKLVLPDLSGR